MGSRGKACGWALLRLPTPEHVCRRRGVEATPRTPLGNGIRTGREPGVGRGWERRAGNPLPKVAACFQSGAGRWLARSQRLREVAVHLISALLSFH